MDELSKLIANLIEEKGGSRNDYLTLLNAIAYHETMGKMDPTTKQIGGGPGRGLFQFEEGKHSGGITAAKRTRDYMSSKGMDVPEWLSTASSGNSLNAASLTPMQQKMLFLGNMRMHPKANFSNVWEGKESPEDFWAKYHWAGPTAETKKRRESFRESYKGFKENEFNIPKDPADFMQTFKDTQAQQQQSNQFALGGQPDPPTKDIEAERQFVRNWISNSISVDKLIDKRQQYGGVDNPTDTYWDVARAMGNLDKVKVNLNQKGDSGVLGGYNPSTNSINFYGSSVPKGTAAHEFTHGTKLDKEISKYAQKDVGYLQIKDDDLEGTKENKRYLNRGEVFPRLMKIRYRLGLQPGDKVTPQTMEGYDPDGEQLFEYYGQEGVIDLLNKSVDASRPQPMNVAAQGGHLRTTGQFDKSMHQYNAGGMHESNPYGGVPIGMGSNGKLNTVEEGETSIKADGGRYIFSDRISLSGKLKKYLK